MIERAERGDAGVYDATRTPRPAWPPTSAATPGPSAKLIDGGKPDPREQISHREGWHRGDRSGALRAGVFGVSDGLVSNTALVMGFAGSGSSHGRRSCWPAWPVCWPARSPWPPANTCPCRASGRCTSARSRWRRRSWRRTPRRSAPSWCCSTGPRAWGRKEAEDVADQIMADREVALDTLAREELGLDPDALGSPWSAAVSSLLAFALGAFVVILPYLIGSGTAALVTAICLAALALFGVGAGIGMLNGRSAMRSGLRQILVGGLAAGVTYAIGRLIGTSVS